MLTDNSEKEKLIERPPIVAVLGHIDHGKTKLLDAIRQTKVVEKEAGGITQNIGAYEINQKGKKITFIDTPGHQAFISMRSHGAKVADLAILVVAADDGPKDQTWESYRIIKEAEIPFLVAINKVDKPEADILKTKNQLLEGGIYLEGMGGDVSFVEISAKEKKGIEELLDLIILMAQMLELKANPKAVARGIVVEAHKDPQRGKSATLIIKDGTISKGQFIATETTRGKIKILEDFLNKQIERASFSTPILVVGFEKLPEVGEEFMTSFSEEDLLEIKSLGNKKQANNIIVFGQEKRPELELNFILKTKTQGTIKALEQIVKNVSKKFEKINFKVIKESTGDISEEDARMADSTGSIILGFEVKIRQDVSFFLQKQNIEVIAEEIIYKIEEKLEEKIKNLLIKQKSAYDGEVEVLAKFNQEKKEQLIGGKVLEGQIKNKSKFEVFRNSEKIGQGIIKNIRREKTDISLAEVGLEYGFLVESQTEIQKNDILKILK